MASSSDRASQKSSSGNDSLQLLGILPPLQLDTILLNLRSLVSSSTWYAKLHIPEDLRRLDDVLVQDMDFVALFRVNLLSILINTPFYIVSTKSTRKADYIRIMSWMKNLVGLVEFIVQEKNGKGKRKLADAAVVMVDHLKGFKHGSGVGMDQLVKDADGLVNELKSFLIVGPHINLESQTTTKSTTEPESDNPALSNLRNSLDISDSSRPQSPDESFMSVKIHKSDSQTSQVAYFTPTLSHAKPSISTFISQTRNTDNNDTMSSDEQPKSPYLKTHRRSQSQILSRPSSHNYQLRLVPTTVKPKIEETIEEIKRDSIRNINQWDKMVRDIGIVPVGIVEQNRRNWESSMKPAESSTENASTLLKPSEASISPSVSSSNSSEKKEENYPEGEVVEDSLTRFPTLEMRSDDESFHSIEQEQTNSPHSVIKHSESPYSNVLEGTGSSNSSSNENLYQPGFSENSGGRKYLDETFVALPRIMTDSTDGYPGRPSEDTIWSSDSGRVRSDDEVKSRNTDRAVRFKDDTHIKTSGGGIKKLTRHRRGSSTGLERFGETIGKTFESLRTVGKRGVQKIPTYDSQGRRIGVLDGGRFSSETETSTSSTDLEEEPNTMTGSVSIKGNLLHLSEDSKDVLVMEMSTGKLQIVGGTVEKLLLRMADENVQDIDYVDTVLYSHPFFISSRDLLENIAARFEIQPPDEPTPEDVEYFNKWRKSIQLKALSVIARWLKIQFEDFERDPVLHQTLQDFLEYVYNSGFRNEVLRIRRIAQIQASSLAMRNKLTPFPAYLLNCPPPLPISPLPSAPYLPPTYLYPPPPRNPVLNKIAPFPRFDSPNLINTSPLLDMDFRDLAKYLTAADNAAFTSITHADYIAKLLDVNEGQINLFAPQKRDAKPVKGWKGKIDLFTARANMLRNWVAIEVCSVSKLKVRRRVIEKFIAVAKVCRELNNFHTLLFIVSGLLSHPVQRLRKTWEGVNNKSALASLEKLLDPSNNMKYYRRALSTCKAPAIPFFPVVMKDLTFIVEGNPSTTPHQHTTMEQTDILINLEKYRAMLKSLRNYTDLSKQKYQFEHLLIPVLRSIPLVLHGPPEYSFTVLDNINNLKLEDYDSDEKPQDDTKERDSALIVHERPDTPATVVFQDDDEDSVEQHQVIVQETVQEQYFAATKMYRSKSSGSNRKPPTGSIASNINHATYNYINNTNANTNNQFFGGVASGSSSEFMRVEKLAYVVESRIAFCDDELVGFWPDGGNAMNAALILASRVE